MKGFEYIKYADFDGELAIEIGSDRGEGSTQWLREYCINNGIEFVSIDIDPLLDYVVKMDGLEWLKQNKKPIKFAYLDNADYIYDHLKGTEHLKEQAERYEKLGIELSNTASKRTHAEQVKRVIRNSSVGTVIAIDDTWMSDRAEGTGALAHILLKKWEVLHMDKLPKGFAVYRRVV